MTHFDVSIITPSFNMLSYLECCHRSVADQEGVQTEHIVVDGGSTDGTVEWLKDREDIVSVVGPDEGMYDAVNKGLSRARGDIVAYLNCDEQYLPGALETAVGEFAARPDVELVFGDHLIVDPDGQLLAFRKGYQPRWPYIHTSHLYVFSCAMFFRRTVVDRGFRFDTRYRDTGDMDLVLRLLRGGARATHVGRYLSAFTWTGKNMSLGENARSEHAEILAAAPAWLRALRWPVNAARLIEKGASGAYRQRFPLEYRLHRRNGTSVRHTFKASSGTWRWPSP